MILSGPDLPKGQEIDTPTQLMDIFPTILEATGVTQKDEDQELEGESLISLAEGKFRTDPFFRSNILLEQNPQST